MARKKATQPTDVELEILNVLWEHEPSTVGQMHEHLSQVRDAGYSTTLKMVQVMFDKGLLVRDESVRPFVYSPTKSQDETQAKMLERLAEGAFGGAMGRLLIKAISSKRVTPTELKEIKRLIRDVERKQKE